MRDLVTSEMCSFSIEQYFNRHLKGTVAGVEQNAIVGYPCDAA
jgi:hypothetical protein